MSRTWDNTTSNYISLGDISTARYEFDSAWTTGAFIRSDTTGKNTVISKSGTTALNLQFAMYVDTTPSSTERVQVVGADSLSAGEFFTGISDDTWYLCIASNNGSTPTATVTVYCYDMSGTDITTNPTDTWTANASSLTPSIIVGVTSTDADPFSGEIAHAFYVDAELSVQEHLNYLRDPQGCIARWIGQHGVQFYLPIGYGSPEPDYSGNVNNGTITGTLALADNPPTQDAWGVASSTETGGGGGGGGGGSSMLLQLLTQSGEGAYL